MNPKKIAFFATLAFLVISLIVLVVALPGKESASPTESETSTTTPTSENSLPANVRNLSVEAGERVSSPLSVTGEARLWYFEASFPVSIESRQGKVIAQAPAQAQGEWMTEEFVPFEAELSFEVNEETDAYLVFEKDNPSGLPEHDESFRLPVVLLPSERPQSMSVEVYFIPENAGDDCSVVERVERHIARTDAPARAALELLIEGPGSAEGLTSTIPADTTINALAIEDGVARVDFSEELNEIAGSCAVLAARSQIEETLKQFSTVEEVVISVEGSVDEALQP